MLQKQNLMEMEVLEKLTFKAVILIFNFSYHFRSSFFIKSVT